MNFFDLHCDTAYECYKKGIGLFDASLQLNLKGGKEFSKWSQCFAIWIKDDAEKPFELYKKIREDFFNKLQGNIPKNLTPILTVEGGAVLENEPDRLDTLKADGVKLITLTWNGENMLGGGADTNLPLTALGREVITKMNRLKIGCDLSHISRKGFFEALEIADYPIATHSNCNAVVEHRRNLTDEQLRLLAQKGGIVGLCFYPVFVGENVFEGVYKNIVHMLELGLEKHIAIGSDFDGAKMDSSLDGVQKIPNLYDFLMRKGIDKSTLDGIFYNNAKKFFAKL